MVLLHPEIEKIIQAGGTHFELSNATYEGFFTEETMLALVSRWPSLSSFSMRGSLSEERIKLLSLLPNLMSLDLRGIHGNMEGQWHHLALLPYLKNLRLETNYLLDRSLFSALSQIPTLRSLTLVDFEFVRTEDFLPIGEVPQLTSLTIDDFTVQKTGDCAFISEECLQYIVTLPNLQKLEVVASFGITERGLRTIVSSSQLKELKLVYLWDLSDKGFALLKKLPNLKSLFLVGCKGISDAGYRSLASLSSLEELHLEHCDQLGNLALASIATLSQLKKLELHRLGSDDSTVMEWDRLGKLVHLEWLELEYCSLSKLMPLLALENLTHLSIASNPISKDQFSLLANFTKLTSLNLGYTGASDAALEILPHLKQLSIDGCKLITDRGILSFVAREKLDLLSFSYCKNISQATIRELHKFVTAYHSERAVYKKDE